MKTAPSRPGLPAAILGLALVCAPAWKPALASLPERVQSEYVNTRFAYRLALTAGWATAAGPLDWYVSLQLPGGSPVRAAICSVDRDTRLLAGSSAPDVAAAHELSHAVVAKRLLELDEDRAADRCVRFKVHRTAGPEVAGSRTTHWALAGQLAGGQVRIKRVAICSRIEGAKLRFCRLQVDYPVTHAQEGVSTFRALLSGLSFGQSTVARADSSPHREKGGAPSGTSALPREHPPLATGGAGASPGVAPVATLAPDFYDSLKAGSTDMSAADTRALVNSFRVSGQDRTEEQKARARQFVVGDVLEVIER